MSTRLDPGTIKQLGAVLLAVIVVVAAGVVVGQAPAIFGAEIDEEPTASIEFEDQRGDGTSVTVDEVSLSDGGFVVISDSAGEIVAVSEYLGADTHDNVTVAQDEEVDAQLLGQLTATVHQDTTDNETFAYETSDGEEDRPYTADGYPVSDSATVTMADHDDDATSTSFSVESVSVPSSATTNETIEIEAEVRNPNEFTSQQHVEFRLDGQVVERQLVELEAGDSRDLTFELNASEVEAGERSVGVLTTDDGAMETVEFEYAGPTTLSVVEADETDVLVNVSLAEDGFVGVEDEGGDLLGTSEQLEPGEHENVSISLDDDLTGNETAVVFEGDPDEPDEATPVDEDGDRVEAAVSSDRADGIE